MSHKAVVGVLLGVLLSCLLGVAWNGTYEAVPAGTDLASDLDTYINGFKTEVRQRAEVEHIFGGSTDDNGLHTVGSARCFQQATAPTDISGGTAALGPYIAGSGSDASTLLTTDEPGATSRDIGAARCWIDTDGPDGVADTPDDRMVATWDETDDRWVYIGAVDPSVAAASERFLSPHARNLIYNGSFEVTDGTGATGATAVPSGWVDSGGATYGYTTPPAEATEGDGVTLTVTDSGGAGDAVTQVLTNLKASTSYLVTARVDGAAATECRLSTSGASTDITAGATLATSTSTTTATVSGVFVTAAALDTVTIILESEGAADACTWDHVGVWELTPNLRQPPAPGYQVATSTLSAVDASISTGGTYDDMVTATVTIPGPGYLVKVSGFTTVDNGNSNVEIGVRLSEDCDGGGETAIATQTFEENGGAGILQTPISLFAIRTGLTPGATCVYDLDVTEATATTDVSVNTPTTAGGALQPDTRILVELIRVD